jgi:hypothetical protein
VPEYYPASEAQGRMVEEPLCRLTLGNHFRLPGVQVDASENWSVTWNAFAMGQKEG